MAVRTSWDVERGCAHVEAHGPPAKLPMRRAGPVDRIVVVICSTPYTVGVVSGAWHDNPPAAAGQTFAGTTGTLVAGMPTPTASRTRVNVGVGRHATGSEISERYVETIARRLTRGVLELAG